MGKVKALREYLDGQTKLSFKNFLIRAFITLSPGQVFDDNWHIDLISRYINSIEKGKLKRLIVNIPPRSLKSIIWSVVWPAWVIGNDPTKKIIVASYSQALSLKHSEDTRLIMESSWYRRIYPNALLLKGANTKAKFKTIKNGFRFATSVGGTLTGEGADILIVDDPQKPLTCHSLKEQKKIYNWFDQTFSSRLNDRKNGVIIVVMQRLHTADLTGYLLEKSNYQLLKIPYFQKEASCYSYGDYAYYRPANTVLNIKRDGIAIIEEMKKDISSYAFEAQYQQEPIVEGGNILKVEWLQHHNEIAEYDYCFQSWDIAATTKENADFSVGITFVTKDSKIYITDITRGKFEFPELKQKVVDLALKHRAGQILIENKSSGIALIQELKNKRLPIVAINPKVDKVVRVFKVISLIEFGLVSIQSNAEYIEEFIKEYRQFPAGAHDDQIDALTQFLDWFRDYDKRIIKIKTMV